MTHITDQAGARHGWRSKPEYLLIAMAAAMALSFATWMALLNNFAVEEAQFSGREIGILQSIREIPGFLAFAAVFLLLLLREQTVAYLSLLLLGLGVVATGFFPDFIGFCIVTLIMSVGFHYYETMQQALTLQLIEKERTPIVMGRQISAQAFASLLAFALIALGTHLMAIPYWLIYAVGGGVTVFITLFVWRLFPKFEAKERQHKKLILRKRYWLYYALTFMSGARRQIFMVFASFMMVEKFGYDVATVSALYLLNNAINIFLAPRIGKLIAKWGEKRALTFEYIGLIAVFVSYAFVSNAVVAAVLYIVDHLFFAFAIAIKSYFQKIADPRDIASTAGVAFSINHIAAVVIPAAFGLLWLVSPAAVFLSGAAMAGVSLVLARNVPMRPEPGNETVRGPRFAPAGAPAE